MAYTIRKKMGSNFLISFSLVLISLCIVVIYESFHACDFHANYQNVTDSHNQELCGTVSKFLKGSGGVILALELVYVLEVFIY